MTSRRSPTRPPRLTLVNRQRAVPLPFLPGLRRFARAVLPGCLSHPGPGEAVLPDLGTVGIVLVSDRTSGQLHERFRSVPGPTDVLTFTHGEIVIGASVAQRQARAHRQTLERELARYIIHGLLHLNGHEDDRPEAAAAMWRVQERLLRRVLPAGAGAR